MKEKITQTTFVSCFIVYLFTLFAAGADGANWPSWRGPVNTGSAPEGNPPLTWSETENIKWKVAIPGSGLSTPVVWEDKLIFLTAIPTKEVKAETPADQGGGRRRMSQGPTSEYKFDVVCLDRKDGKMIWQKTVTEGLPHQGHHADGSFASYSPVTDGKHIWANFGSRGFYCLDMEGNIKWSQDLVKMDIRAGFGEGTSPCVADNAVIVVCDHEGDSFIVAFNKETGEELWKKERDERTSWTTPIAVEVDGKIQIIVNGANLARAYDLHTGDVIWTCGGQTDNVIPTSVAGFGNVYLTSGFRGAALYAIKLGQTGDLTNSDAIVWKVTRDTPYVPSPVLAGDKIYVCSGNKAEISCYDAKDGKENYVKQMLEGLSGIYASPVGVKDRVYFVGRKGTTKVIKVSDTLEVLATNKLDDGFDASPIIVGDELYLKGSKNLYCIAKQ